MPEIIDVTPVRKYPSLKMMAAGAIAFTVFGLGIGALGCARYPGWCGLEVPVPATAQASIDPALMDKVLLTDSRIAAYEDSITKLEREVELLKQRPVEAPPAPITIVHDEKEWLSAADWLETNRELSLTLPEESETTPAPVKDAGLELEALFTSLRKRVVEGEAFEEPLLEMIAKSEGNAPLLEVLEPLRPAAKSGIPTEQELQQRFTQAMRLHGADMENAPAEGVLARFITIRRIEGGGAGGESALLSNIQKKVEDGEFEEAAQLLLTLPEERREAFMLWQEDVQQYQRIHAQMDLLHDRLMKSASMEAP